MFIVWLSFMSLKKNSFLISLQIEVAQLITTKEVISVLRQKQEPTHTHR